MFPTNNLSTSQPTSSNSSTSSNTSLQNIEVFHGMSGFQEEMRLAATTPKKRAGRKIFKETRHPVYRGVRKRNLDKWVCEMREPNKKTKIWLGTFPTAEMAARAHDVAAIALRGRYACLNFADSVWRLPIPATSNTKDIQKAAAEAAEAFRPDKSLKTNEIETVVAIVTGEKLIDMFCVEKDEDEVLSMPEELINMFCVEQDEDEVLWRNMVMMSPTHSLGNYEYEHFDLDFQDDEISLWNFEI
ncbi:dehydration-responsive element-binding protein 1E-like [Vicia villosa]|uniref:dehydration-responsive element-binding protein 1E-like n=1 Tax=Vicia villosa TaxID=3911 RepID=UPI00273AE8F7|nr:dehydration-responsive element-binding protein 1E-like [Vicia villosa]